MKFYFEWYHDDELQAAIPLDITELEMCNLFGLKDGDYVGDCLELPTDDSYFISVSE